MRLLVTGMSGFLGYAVGRLLSADPMALSGRGGFTEVVATWHRRPVPGFEGRQVRLDLADQTALGRVLTEIGPQAVIHLAAIAAPNRCEAGDAQGEVRAVNVHSAATIAAWCAREGCPMVFTSTDLVFDGTRPPYAEGDTVHPLNAYARQKRAAEEAIQRCHPGAVICRMALMFGYAGAGVQSFTQEMVTGIAAGRPLRLFTDEFRTPLSTRCAARGLLLALNWPGGVYHLGGSERISRFDFGRRLAVQLGVGHTHLQSLTRAEMPMAAQRPADVSLDHRKAAALGFAPAALDAAIAEMLGEFGY